MYSKTKSDLIVKVVSDKLGTVDHGINEGDDLENKIL